jgi:hypothetical protein
MRLRVLIAIGSFFLLILLVACGSNSKPATTTFGTPSPTPGSPTPVPTAASDHYFATFFVAQGHNTDPQATIDLNANANDGKGTVTFVAATAAATYTLQFCPAGGNFTNCFDVATVQAPGPATFTFPRKGTFTGVFTLNQSGAIVLYAGIDNPGPGASFAARLLPAGSGTGSGVAAVTGATAHVAINGATASHSYNIALCTVFNCSETIGTLLTDAQGNGAADISLTRLGFAGSIGLTDSSGTVYVSAFRVQ